MAKKVLAAVVSAWVCPWCKTKHLLGTPGSIKTCKKC